MTLECEFSFVSSSCQWCLCGHSKTYFEICFQQRARNVNIPPTPPPPLSSIDIRQGKTETAVGLNINMYSIFLKLAYLDSATAKSKFNFSLFDSSAPLTLNIHVFWGDNLDLPMSAYPKIKMEARSWLIPPTNPSSMFKQHQMWNVGIYICML